MCDVIMQDNKGDACPNSTRTLKVNCEHTWGSLHPSNTIQTSIERSIIKESADQAKIPTLILSYNTQRKKNKEQNAV